MIKINGKDLEKEFTFSGGERQVRINVDDIKYRETIPIVAKLKSSNDIIDLLLVLDAVKYYNRYSTIRLVIPYFPFARQDRRCYRGEAYSVNVFINLLENALDENDTVTIVDPHCSTSIFPKRYIIIPKLDILSYKYSVFDKYDVFMAPDKGAFNEVKDLAKYFNKYFIYADKIRDPDTGYITSMEISYNFINLRNKKILVIDDICDGGATFNMLTDYVDGDISLYVTHGIFSKGLSPLSKFSEIITTDSFYAGGNDNIEVINL